MPDPSPGRTQRAGLARVASPDGTLAIVGMDQRDTLRRMLTAAGQPADPGELRSFKADVVAALSPEFRAAVVTVCDEGGASGFIAGRVHWQEAVALTGAARQQFLATAGRQRLDESIAAIAGRARPWCAAWRARPWYTAGQPAR